MRIDSPFNPLLRQKILHFLVTVFLLLVSLAHGAPAFEEPPGNPPPVTNPHASPPGPNTPIPTGIVGLALHITAARIGDPAQLIIRAVHPSGPAARAGLTHGEEILTVDGEPVTGKIYQEAVSLIRGEVGSSVTLGLTGPQGERTVSLIRVSESVLLEQTPPAL